MFYTGGWIVLVGELKGIEMLKNQSKANAPAPNALSLSGGPFLWIDGITSCNKSGANVIVSTKSTEKVGVQ